MKRFFLTCSLAVISLLAASAKGTKAPDFRFPEKVAADAERQIRQAAKDDNGQMLIDGLIRLSIAKTKISADFTQPMIETIDSVAKTASDRKIRAIARSFEAELYSKLYNRDQIKFRSREQAATPPSDIMAWSDKDFRDKVIELTDSILADRAELEKAGIDSYSKIIIPSKALPEFMPTLFDMLAHRAISQLSSFNERELPRLIGYKTLIAQTPKTDDVATDKINEIYRMLLSVNRPGSPAFIYTELQRIASYDAREKQDYLLNLYIENIGSPYSIEVLSELIDATEYVEKKDEQLKLQVYRLALEAEKRHSGYKRINILKQQIDRMQQAELRGSHTSLIKSNDSLKVMLQTRNIKEVRISVYALPENIVLDYDLKLDKLLPKLKKTGTFNFPTDSSILWREKEVSLPPMAAGRYLIIPEYTDARTNKKIQTRNNNGNSELRVSDIDIMIRARINGENRIYVVDAHTSKPLFNARLYLTDRKGNIVSTRRINRYGYAIIEDSETESGKSAYATYGNDRSQSYLLWFRDEDEYDRQSLNGKIFTDRGIYRPGETVKYAGVLYTGDNHSLSLFRNQSAIVSLLDSNRKCLQADTLHTDNYGRLSGEFSLPKEGLTGSFSIEIESDLNGEQENISTWFEVSEYKAPTFLVEYDEKKSELADTAALCIRGSARTYSGHPVANAKIEYAVTGYSTWFFSSGFTDLSGNTVTDDNGCWKIRIPASNLSDKEKFAMVNLQLFATDEKGEKQTLSTSLSIGQGHFLKATEAIRRQYIADSTLHLPIAVSDGKQDIESDVNYEITGNDGKVIVSGSFRSSNPIIDMRNVASGKYTVNLWLDNRKDKSLSLQNIIVFRPTDTRPPFETPFWTTAPDEGIRCNADGSFAFDYGNSFGNYIYYVVLDNGKAVADSWKMQEAGMHRFEGKAEFSGKGSSSIRIYSMHNHSLYQKELQLLPFTPQDSIEILTETFRDNVTPGGKETWKLRIRNNNGKRFTSAVIANMYDAALNAIRPNTYTFYATQPHYTEFWADSFYNGIASIWKDSPLKSYDSPIFQEPYFNCYGESLLPSRTYYYLQDRVAGATITNHKLSSRNNAPEVEEAAATDELVKKELFTGSGAVADSNAPALRDDGVKSAFFLPGLVSDENGEVTFTFDVPDRNTQWQFSAIAYTEDLQTAYINRIVTAAKPLMVEPNMPRFVREGDRITLKATAMNNSDSTQTVTVRFEIADGSRTATKDIDGITLRPGGSSTVDFGYGVTAGTALVCKVSVLKDGRTVDGEQNLLPVLPATTEVIEAQPFYLSGKDKHFKLQLPEFEKGSRITFEYTDNPIWYAVMALPSVMSESATASAYIGNYYATTVAGRIVAENRGIAEAIDYWKSHNSLKSPLDKNGELKTVALGNTPWADAADKEDNALSQLADLTDPATIQYRKQKSLTSLADLQDSDGGIAWFDGCRSSVYTTEQVLRRMGNLREMGCFDENDALANRIIAKAIAFCDNYYEKRIDFSDKKKYSYHIASDYVYIRSMHNAPPLSGKLKTVADSVVRHTIRYWGSSSVSEKAEAAILLANYGKMQEARLIIESLRQHARKSPERGYYWDVDYYDKAALAANALKAFHKIDSGDPAIDGIRQWLLMQKETRQWATGIATCDAVNALLSTGADWTGADRRRPAIEIGGIRIDTENAEPYFGYIKRTVDPGKMKGGILSVSHADKNPAWGAVYCQYNAKMEEVKKNATDDVKIEKQFFVYGADNKLADAPGDKFKLGDRVQVRLTIRTERDLDFVAVTDDRAACFEPADQTAAYSWEEGLHTYRETRDNATNIFIDRMPKGSYVISYDVYVNNIGSYAGGIATLQCQYAPQLTAHTGGASVTVE